MAGPGGYDADMPIVEQHLEKYQRALASVRRTHRGRPVTEVREALAVAFDAEGIQVWDEVADDAARLISREE